ncbi:MAG: UDP-3-O-acyl-N-acetylglucosamine deacetylase [Desulfotomaculum sp.]|nr:UDP-3-O-acyl-N-acetylglucosamine deacetylase [Desulfotomaculum sp.]
MQVTINSAVHCRGIDITGTRDAFITLEPAEENTGIVFIREDLPHKPQVRCCSRNAVVDKRWTSLEEKGTRVEHTEHLLAAVKGLGIDNLAVRMNCPSIPVVDSYSCKDFVKAILQSGLKKQTSPKKYIDVNVPLVLKDQFYYQGRRFDKFIFALPANKLELIYILDYPKGWLPSQMAGYVIEPEIFITQLADARSFITAEEFQQVQKMIGEGMKSVLVFPQDGSRKLRYKNEPARHKLVDLLGDLGMCGLNIRGKFIAYRSGHKLNIEMVKKLTGVESD